ncbi:MFS sugar [Mycena sanguinolenta]|uniref:MFS sugar n=1 Tax=Mycena sanguinolenta TaxID=230812 RepID=A0A8H6X751_9AGAR|nr:MFS sugar [Mycena sanguinolenta]
MEFEPRPKIQFQVSANSAAPLVRAMKRSRIPMYVWPTLFTAFGGFLWGFDTGSIGPIIVMPQFEDQFGHISATIQGLLVSSMIATAASSAVFSGALSDRISRTYTISLGAFVFSVGCAIGCSAKALPQLFVGRCIAGFGEGIFISSITVYVMEISPTSKRGRTMTVVQLFNTVGVALGYFTCFGTVRHAGSFSWRVPLALQAIVAITLAIGTAFFPHSPHWLLSVGRSADAEAATLKLGLQLAEIRKEDETAATGPAAEVAKQTIKQQAKELWAKDVRFRTLFGLFLMGMQQACGIDAVLYYAPVLFQQAGLSSTSASFLASGVSGIVMVVLTAGSLFFQDRWARRTQMISGGSVIAGCMLLMGVLYASKAAQTRAGGRTLIALIYIFIAAFISTMGRRNPCYRQRNAAQANAGARDQSRAVLWLAFSTPLFLTRSTSGPYFLFGTCALLTVLVCAVFQPETKGLSLDMLDQEFKETKLQSALTILTTVAPTISVAALKDEVLSALSDDVNTVEDVPHPKEVRDFELCKAVKDRGKLTGEYLPLDDYKATLRDAGVMNWEALFVQFRDPDSGELRPVEFVPFEDDDDGATAQFAAEPAPAPAVVAEASTSRGKRKARPD